MLVYPVSIAGAASRLETALGSATECTDGLVRLYASRSCDPPTQIAASAVAACQANWDALAQEAVTRPKDDGTKQDVDAYRRRLRAYADGMQHEYAKIAELKAIDLRGSEDCLPQ